MVSVFKIAGIAFATTAASLLLRAYRPELSMQIALAAGALLLILTLDELKNMSSFLQTLFERTGMETAYLKVLLKVIGIAYFTQFAADLCRDAGEGAIAGKVEFAGRVMILTLCLPILASILDLVSGILVSNAMA